MNQIDTTLVGGSTAATLRQYAEQTIRRPAERTARDTDDSVEISELASFLNRLAELPDERARKIIDIRNAISRGEYLTADKLNEATDRLLNDL